MFYCTVKGQLLQILCQFRNLKCIFFFFPDKFLFFPNPRHWICRPKAETVNKTGKINSFQKHCSWENIKHEGCTSRFTQCLSQKQEHSSSLIYIHFLRGHLGQAYSQSMLLSLSHYCLDDSSGINLFMDSS